MCQRFLKRTTDGSLMETPWCFSSGLMLTIDPVETQLNGGCRPVVGAGWVAGVSAIADTLASRRARLVTNAGHRPAGQCMRRVFEACARTACRARIADC